MQDMNINATLSTNPRSNRSDNHLRVHGCTDDEIDDSVSTITSVVNEEKLYVALGKDLKEGKSILVWAMQNSARKKICFFHVHQPPQLAHCTGGRYPINTLIKQEQGRKKMQEVLNEYLHFCTLVGVRAEKLDIETECIEKGIVKAISQYGIGRLVMGAAASKHYSRKMTGLKSKKAIFVNSKASLSCHIWFVCKGHLIFTRKGCIAEDNEEAMLKVQQSSPHLETEKLISLIAGSDTIGPSTQQNHIRPSENYYRETSLTNLSQGSRLSTISSGDVASCVAMTPYVSFDGTKESQEENDMQLLALPLPKEDANQALPPMAQDERADCQLYNQLEQAKAEARNLKRQAFEEMVRRGRAEQVAIDANRRARASESAYTEELKQRKEVEMALVKLQNQRDKLRYKLQFARGQQSKLEKQNAESDEKIKDLKKKCISAAGLLKYYRHKWQTQRDNALKLEQNLRQNQTNSPSANLSQFFSEFSFIEIEEATRSFHPSLKIGEGSYGTLYKGLLRHTEVAIKIYSHICEGPSEFIEEVDILSNLRHPNLVTLIGACQETPALIYEYLPNGSLEDRLNCKDNTPPLSWQTRIRIAAELCSTLVFLHSCKPNSIVHGDLKPDNILLGANFVCKLSNFGFWRAILADEDATMEATACYKSNPHGPFAYMDPELFSSGGLTTRSDVYSFGAVLLRLLTGKHAREVIKEVEYAIDSGDLKSVLDPSAGDWSYVQAHQLAHLVLRCVDISKNRPDLGSEVWRVLQAMQTSCSGFSSSVRIEDPCQAPHYFLCPILQEVMQDPRMAADGFTYEAEALNGWLELGHDTSPMTNLKLANTNLVPNLALRSAIQEWLQNKE